MRMDNNMRIRLQVVKFKKLSCSIFFMLNSAEHEIFSANKYENTNNNSAMFSKKEFASVSNLRFISRSNFMLS